MSIPIILFLIYPDTGFLFPCCRSSTDADTLLLSHSKKALISDSHLCPSWHRPNPILSRTGLLHNVPTVLLSSTLFFSLYWPVKSKVSSLDFTKWFSFVPENQSFYCMRSKMPPPKLVKELSYAIECYVAILIWNLLIADYVPPMKYELILIHSVIRIWVTLPMRANRLGGVGFTVFQSPIRFFFIKMQNW